MTHDHDSPITITVPRSLAESLIDALKAATARPPNDPRIDEILSTLKGIRAMSGQFSTDLQTMSANIADLGDAMTTGFAANDAAIQDLKDKVAAGGAVSAADLATLETNNAAIKTAADSIRAHLVAGGVVTPPAVVFNANDPTPNSAGGRNTDQLPGFDPTQPVTA